VEGALQMGLVVALLGCLGKWLFTKAARRAQKASKEKI
jgi:hypothetical protein